MVFAMTFKCLEKMAGILPGLLGTIVSYVIHEAGQVVSVLDKNAWLLIVCVAERLIERVTKRTSRLRAADQLKKKNVSFIYV